MSDAATESRGMAESDRPIAEHRHEGNGRCMIGRAAFAAIFGSSQACHWAGAANVERKTAGMNACRSKRRAKPLKKTPADK
jgi:hypothetical protein